MSLYSRLENTLLRITVSIYPGNVVKIDEKQEDLIDGHE